MNLLFITTHNPFGSRSHGGAESSSRLIAEQLARRGHRVTYLSEQVDEAERAVARRAGVELRGFTRRAEKGNRLVAELARRSNNRQLRRCLADRDVDLVYCFYETTALETALALRQQRPQVKIVMRMAGLHWYERIKRNPKNAARFARWFDTVDSVNFISAPLVEMTEQKLAELGMRVGFRHAFVLDIGSSAPAGRTVAYAALPEEPFEIVMAARFSSYQKRQDILVRAAAMLHPAAAIRITLIGDGETRRDVEALAAAQAVTDRVVFCPFQSQAALWQQLERTHLLCHSVEYEGLGKIIIESMALGLPVLASEVEPIRSYITDGENGFLVQNDSAAWAAKITRLAADPAARARVSTASMDYVRRHCDPLTQALAYERQFETLSRGPPATVVPAIQTRG